MRVESKCRRWCQLRDEHLIATAPCPTARSTHAPENARQNAFRLIGNGRAFQSSDREAETTCKRPRPTSETNSTPTFLPQKKRLGNCRTLSRVACLCSTERLIDTWAMQLTQRMRFRMRSSPLTNTWISLEGRRKCRRGSLPSSAIVLGCNCGEGHGRSTYLSTSNSGTNRGLPCQSG